MDRDFSSYFERLEIIRAFACLHLIGKRGGRSSPIRDPPCKTPCIFNVTTYCVTFRARSICHPHNLRLISGPFLRPPETQGHSTSECPRITSQSIHDEIGQVAQEGIELLLGQKRLTHVASLEKRGGHPVGMTPSRGRGPREVTTSIPLP